MATATQVTIKVVVDNSQAGPAIDQTVHKLGDFSMVMNQQEQDAQRLARSMDLTGISYKKAADGVDHLGGHITTGLDSVRLLSQEFGLRMPRAIEAMLSRMPNVVSVLGSILPLMAGIAGIEIFTRAIDGGIKLYKELFDVNAEMRKYLDEASKAEYSKFIDEASLETALTNLRDVNAEIDKLDQKRRTQEAGVIDPKFKNATIGDIPGLALGGFESGALANTGRPDYTKQDGVLRAQDAARQAANDARTRELQRTNAQEDLKNQAKLNEAGLAGAALIAQKKKDAYAEAEGAQRVQLANELDQQKAIQKLRELQIEMGEKDPTKLANVPTVEKDAGAAKAQQMKRGADAEATSQEIALNRETNLAILKANDERVQSSLQGEALYFRKMQDDIRELTVELTNQGKAAEIPAKVREINEKYFNDMSERAVKAQNESGLRVRRADATGLTGAARIYADQDIQVNENNTKLANDPEAQHAANVAAATEANNKLTELQQQFTDRMESIEDGRVAATLNGYQRIDAAAQKQIDDVEKAFAKDWGGVGVDPNSAQAIAAEKTKQDAIAAIQAGAAADRTHLTLANQALDASYTREAVDAERRVRNEGLTGWVADYKNALAAIEAQRQSQMLKLQEEAKKDGLSSQEVENDRVSIDRAANAQIAAQNQQMQHQIANNLEEAFTNPIDFIKRKMQQMFMDIVADWIMRTKLFQGIFGQSVGTAGTGGAATSAQGGGLLGAIGGAIRPTFGGQPVARTAAGSAAVKTASEYSGSYSGSSPSAAGSGAPAYTPHMPAYTGSASGGAAGTVESVAGGARGLYQDVSSARAQIAARSASAQPAAVPGISSSALDTGLSGSFSAAAGVPGPAEGPPSIDGTGLAMPGPSGAPSIGAMPNAQVPAGAPAASGAAKMASTGLAVAGAGIAGYEGYQDTAADFKSGSATGTLKGMMGDAMAGAAIGSLFGPVGTLVGAGVGAAVGLVAGVTGAIMGEGGRLAARDYYKKTLFPEMESERNGGGATDYQMAISNVNRIASDGMEYMAKKWGGGAAQWVNDNYLKKEQALADGEMLARAKGGSYAVKMSAAQFHTGGEISGFGDLSTGGDEGYIHARMGETVMNPSATQSHGAVLNAMNSGANASDVARMYLAGSPASSSSGGGSTTHNHQWSVNTMDAKSFDRFMDGPNTRTMVKKINSFATEYAGDGISG